MRIIPEARSAHQIIYACKSICLQSKTSYLDYYFHLPVVLYLPQKRLVPIVLVYICFLNDFGKRALAHFDNEPVICRKKLKLV